MLKTHQNKEIENEREVSLLVMVIEEGLSKEGSFQLRPERN